MKLTPENFEPILDRELRDLWKLYRDENVRRLILEVHRAREVLGQAHSDALAVQSALYERKDGDVKARLRAIIDLLLSEKIRLGAYGGRPPVRV